MPVQWCGSKQELPRQPIINYLLAPFLPPSPFPLFLFLPKELFLLFRGIYTIYGYPDFRGTNRTQYG